MLLMLAREFGQNEQCEYIKMAFIRAIFLEKLAQQTILKDRMNEVFLMGTLSMLDAISGHSIDELLQQVPLKEDVKAALKNQEDNPFSQILNFAKAYEIGDWDEIEDKVKKYNLKKENISKTYLECVINAEMIFNDKSMATS